MKKFTWVVLVLAFVAIAMPSHAQQLTPIVDISGGYSFFRIGGANLNGGSASAAYNVTSWLGVVGDFGYYHGSPSGASVNAMTYTFGPRFSLRRGGRFVPFGQALFGASHLSASVGGFTGSANPFAYSAGGGAEMALSSSGTVSLRPEVDYFGLRANGGTANSIRVSVAIVYHFGGR